jgi:hypothetical protein
LPDTAAVAERRLTECAIPLAVGGISRTQGAISLTGSEELPSAPVSGAMEKLGPDRIPDELQDVADLLREQRTEFSPLELDRIKVRAMGGASKATPNWVPRKGWGMRTRVLTLMIAAVVFGGTVAGGIAGGGGGYGDNAGEGQYGCDDDGGHGDFHSRGTKDRRCDRDHGGEGHHHHHHWRNGGPHGYQWSDDGSHWSNWNGASSDW